MLVQMVVKFYVLTPYVHNLIESKLEDILKLLSQIQ